MVKIDEITEIEIKDGILTISQFDNNKVILNQSSLNAINEAINYTHSCETLEVKEEIVFEDWLKQHRFTKDINHYIKNNITYREWEVFNMYTMDVYNL